MTDPTLILIPLINPNEPGALLAAIPVSNGQHVNIGEALCTLETTKSTVEINADTEGFVVGLVLKPGQTAQAGDVFCYIADSPDWTPPSPENAQIFTTPSVPKNLRISQAALLLATQQNFDLTQFSGEVFVTQKMVQELIDQSQKPIPAWQGVVFLSNSIIVYGGGGHGKALIDLLRTLGTYPIAGVVDDDMPAGSTIMGATVLGGANILELLVEHGVHMAVNAVGGIGNIHSRIKVFDRLTQAGFTCPALVHPTAFVELSANLAEGVQVMPHAYVGSEAQVSYGAIINTGAIVSHDCVLGEYANLSPGAILAGEVSVGAATLIGMGATVNLRVKVGDRVRIGNGATVKQDVPAGIIVHAGAIWPT